MRKDYNIYIREGYKIPASYKEKKSFPLNMVVKVPDVQQKDIVLKAVREKQDFTYKSKHIKIAATISAQTVKAGISCSKVFQLLKKSTSNVDLYILQKCLPKLVEK